MEKYDCDIKSTLLFPLQGGGGQGSIHNINICDKGLSKVSAMNGFLPCWFLSQETDWVSFNLLD